MRGKGKLQGIVVSEVFKGVHYEMVVRTNGYDLLVQSTELKKVDEEVGINIKPDLIHVMKR